MSLFSRKPDHGAASGYSVIDEVLRITGDISTLGTVRVDGRVEGTLHRADTLIIGAGGTVIGNVEAREVVIGGKLVGNLTVSARVEVQATATVNGDIRSAAVLLLEGGTVHGHVSVSASATDAAPLPAERRLKLTPNRDTKAIAQG